MAIYLTFPVQRAIDQVIHDVALQNLPVVRNRPRRSRAPTARRTTASSTFRFFSHDSEHDGDDALR